MNKTRLGIIGMLLIIVILWFFVWRSSLDQVSFDEFSSLSQEVSQETVVKEEVKIEEVIQEEINIEEEVDQEEVIQEEIPIENKIEQNKDEQDKQDEDMALDLFTQEDGLILKTDIPKQVLFDVPFSPQAPFGDWDDIRKQNACEEITIIMAMRWVEGKDLTFAQAEQEILALVDFEQKTYGHFHDTSVADTVKVFKAYFNYDRVFIKYDIDYQDIKQELAKGNLIIVPADGTKLGNPYFTPPGPIEHMLVIRGYDDLTQEFITNDPGTKRGEGFRYDYQVLENAIRDYPSGYHEPILEIRKAMIIIEK